MQQGFVVFSFRHPWQVLSIYLAECGINFGKPAVWKVAHEMLSEQII